MEEIDELVRLGVPLTPEQLHRLITTASPGSIVPLDASWFADPSQYGGRSPQEIYAVERIPGAQFLDLDVTRDRTSPFPHMLPQQSVLEEYLTSKSVGVDDLLVVYDYPGNMSAPRAAWMLRVFQHKRVLLLDHYPLYKHSLPLDNSPPPVEGPVKKPYKSPGLNPALVAYHDQVLELAGQPTSSRPRVVVDVRPAGMFSQGHVPGAINIPSPVLLDPNTRQFKTTEQLRALFDSARVLDKDLVVMCRTGMMAGLADQALRIAGSKGSWAVYDGSWSEYGTHPGSLIEP